MDMNTGTGTTGNTEENTKGEERVEVRSVADLISIPLRSTDMIGMVQIHNRTRILQVARLRLRTIILITLTQIR